MSTKKTTAKKPSATAARPTGPRVADLVGDAGPDLATRVAWTHPDTGEFGDSDGNQWRVHPRARLAFLVAEGERVAVVDGVCTVG